MKKIFKDWRVIAAFVLSLFGGGTWYYTESISEPDIETETEELSFASTLDDVKFIPTAMDSLNPSAPVRVYRIHYLTKRVQTIGGEGLPQYDVEDYYNEVGYFSSRGKVNWKELNKIDSTVLKVFDPVVFVRLEK